MKVSNRRNIARHCEPAKQSSVLIYTWIASQARNDGGKKLKTEN